MRSSFEGERESCISAGAFGILHGDGAKSMYDIPRGELLCTVRSFGFQCQTSEGELKA